MKVTDVMELNRRQLNDMSTEELREASRVISSAANKRIKRIEQTNIYSPALEALKESGSTHFGTTMKTTDAELRKNIFKAQSFIQNKTSTAGGARKLATETLHRLQLEDVLTPQHDIRSYWRLYNKMVDYSTALKGTKESFGQAYNSTQVQVWLGTQVYRDKKAPDDIIKEFNDRKNDYEKQNEEYREIGAGSTITRTR